MPSFMLFPILFVSLVILLSASSSSHYVRRKKNTKYAVCKSFILPNNAEWIRKCYGKRCKGLFVCCEGYKMVVKTVCNKRGRWRVKTFCVPIRSTPSTTTTQMSTTRSSTASNTATPSTTAASSTTPSTTASSTTTPSTTASSSTTPSTTVLTSTSPSTSESSSTSPSTSESSSTTPSTTTLSTTTLSTTTQSTTSTQQIVQCDSDPTVENGIITSNEISTEVGSVVQFNCTAGFTENGRVGSLRCNEVGVFVQSLLCTDCRFRDMEESIGTHTGNDPVESAAQCNQLCNIDSDCISSQFFEPDRCIFIFQIEELQSGLVNLEFCRQKCYENIRCEAFIVVSEGLDPSCRLFTKQFDQFFPSADVLSSICI